MTSIPSLPPDLERFVREQLAIGRFGSEGELIRTAIRLLEGGAEPAGRDTAPERAPTGRRPRGLLADLQSDLSFDDVRAARRELWGGLRPGDP